MNLDFTSRQEKEISRLQKELDSARTLLETANSIVIRWSKEGIIQYMNDFGLRFFGYSAVELIGQNLSRILPKIEKSSGRDLFKLAKDIASNPDQYQSVPNENITHDGRTVWVAWTNKGIFDEQGNVLEILAIGNDITALKEAEQKRFEYHEKLDAALESMEDAVFISDNQGNFVHFNKAFATFHRFKDKSECLSRLADYPKILDVYTVDGELLTLDQWVVARALRGESDTNAEYTLQRKDTGKTWIGSYNFGPFFNEQGNIAGSVVAARDITAKKRTEESLQKSHQNLRHAQSLANIGNWSLDPDVGVPEWSDELYRILERKPIEGPYSLAEYNNLFKGEWFEKFNSAIQRAIHEGQPYDHELKIEFAPDHVKWVRAICEPESKPGSKKYLLRGTVQEITERKQAEEKLEQNHNLLSKLARLVPGVVYQYRLFPDGTSAFPYASPGMNDIYEVTPEEVQEDATPAFGRLHPDDHDRVANLIQESAQTLKTFHCEFRVVLPRQGLCWRWSQAYPERLDDGSTLWHGIISDITERKRAEEENQRLTDRLVLATSAARLGIWDWNVRENTMIWDDRMFELYGVIREETPSNLDAWLNGLHPVDKETAIANSQAALDGEKDYDTEFRVLHPDGTIKHLKANGLVIIGVDGKPDRMLGINMDITEKKQAEIEKAKLEQQLQQSQKIESIGQLAGGVAHDFNNMLGIILGHTELALMKAHPDNPFVKDLEQIQTAAKRSAGLTRQLLTFARKETIAPQVLDLNETVAEMLTMLQRLIGENIQLSLNPDPDLWSINLDPTQLNQILANLCVNARDAIDGIGTITITSHNCSIAAGVLEADCEVQPGDYVLLSISDDGHGISQGQLKQIFEPFFTTKEIGKGTGLGLSTVYGAVKQNHGYIDVFSELGQGTTFHIYLPRQQADVGPDEETAPSQPLGQGEGTVLVVEDDEMLLDLTKTMLEEGGYKVLEALTCDRAINLVKEYPEPIHLLLSDIIMPKMNGKDLWDQIRVLRPELKVIFTSGYTADFIAQQGKLKKGTHFLQKPVSLETLTLKVQEVLGSE